MRTYISITLLFFASGYLHAQDTLYKADGSVHIVKILEVNDSQVKYKLYDNQEGPLYVIGKDNVTRIKFENGLIEDFPVHLPEKIIPLIKIDPRTTDFGRNFISVNIFDLLTQNTLTFGYEYTFKSGLISLKVPVSFRFDNNGYYPGHKSFGTGLDLNLYPYGQGKAKFFYGPSFEYRKYEFSNSNYEINSVYALLFQAGYLFQPTKHLNFSINAGIGYARLISDNSYYNNTGDVATKAGLNIGYKF